MKMLTSFLECEFGLDCVFLLLFDHNDDDENVVEGWPGVVEDSVDGWPEQAGHRINHPGLLGGLLHPQTGSVEEVCLQRDVAHDEEILPWRFRRCRLCW